MGILLMDGFGQCATGSNAPASLKALSMNWTGWLDRGTDVNITALDSGVKGVRKYIDFPNSPYQMTSYVWDGVTTLVFGCRVYRYDTNACLVANLGENKWFGVHTDGTLRYSRNQGGDLVAGGESWGSTASIPVGSWTYVEIKVVFSLSATGSIEFYIGGNLDSTHTGIQTTRTGSQNATQSIGIGWVIGASTVRPNWRFADIYVSDGYVNGISEVWYQPCDQAGSLAQFTPSAGNNQDNVDETTDPDGDTTYNESSTPGNKDRLGHNVTHDAGPVAIQALAWVRANGDGFAKVRNGVYRGGSEAVGAVEQISESWAVIRGPIQETDPSTASAWTAAGADAAETVIEHVA